MSNPWVRPIPVPIKIVDCASQADLDGVLNGDLDGYRIRLHGDVEYLFDGTLLATGAVIEGVGQARVKGQLYLDFPDCYLLSCNGIKQFNARMTADRCGFINNVFQGDGITDGSAGILSTGGKDQLTYGNIVTGYEHALYIQNKGETVEFAVHNYLGDCVPNAAGGGRSVHAYTQQPDNMNSLQLIQNVFSKNEVLIGGEGGATMPLYNLLQENWAIEADFNLGYKRPECTDLISNHMYNSILLRQHFAGDDVVTDDWSIVNGNEIWNDGVDHGWDHIRFSTHNSGAGLRSVEQWNNNKYFVTDYFRAPFLVKGMNTYCRGLNQWREATIYGGNQFDTNSVEMIGPPPDQYWLIPNDYDPDRALLICWGANEITFSRPLTYSFIDDPYTEIPIGQQAIFGTPNQLNVFIIRYKQICNLPEARRLLNEAYVKSTQKGVKTRIKQALINMEGC